MTAPVSQPVFDPPRFKGSPVICTATNRPAHYTQADAKAFLARFAPDCHVLEIWLCNYCDRWHTRSVAPSPSGSSSGTTRFAKHYE